MVQNIDLADSLWAAIAPAAPPTLNLDGPTRAEVAIIGAGFTGCSAALHLAEKGVDVAVIEAKEIGWGGSGRNVGLCNAGLYVDPEFIIRYYGERHGPRAVEGLGNAPLLVRSLIEKHGIDCDPGTRGILKGAHSHKALEAMRETVRQWRALGKPVDLIGRDETRKLTGSPWYLGGMIDRRSFTLEPLAYARGLGGAAIHAGARIYTGERASKLEPVTSGVRIVTARGDVTAGHVIVATGAYDSSLLPGLERAFIPVGYFLFATEPLSHNLRQAILPGKQAVYDMQPSLLAVRYDRDHRLIVGNLGWLPPKASGHAWARHALGELYPGLGEFRFTRGWSGILDFTDDHMPWLARPMERVVMIGGYNGRGIAPGTFWGKVLADWATGLPDDELPIPVQGVPRIRARWLKGQGWANAFRAYRAQMRLRRSRRQG